MAPTPSSSSSSKQNHQAHAFFKTPQSKNHLNFISTTARTTPKQPTSTAKETSFPPPSATATQEHPIEVIGRIRDYPERKEKPVSILQANNENNTLRVRSEIGYRDFTLDGISLSVAEDLDNFYKRFVEGRINGVKLGDKCTIMMYGPTGSGKSHTMFGCAKQPGIVYRALRDILGGEGAGEGERIAGCAFVQVSVLEIYNEEIYDLLSSNRGGIGFGWAKGGITSKVKLEVMGKKAKNAAFISGTEAGKISKEIQKVEKRRIVKSTLCNDRSSRSHCMIILDVPTVGGRLMLVDMAGSENIEQAGQNGFEAKMQTAKINQGNIALKRVVESIANGDSHVPFRDSKLTMLLQDSFEDDKSKILMILCASPDPKEMHKTICTLEYGAKAKCIVRGPHTPTKDKVGADDSSAVILGSRLAAMDQFIYKLQMENKLREKERNEAHKQLMKKEEEVVALRALIEEKVSATSEEEINLKVNERTKMLKFELEKKLEECQRMAEEFVEMERRRMEERMVQQQQEVEMLRSRLVEIENQLCRGGSADENGSRGNTEASNFARRLMGIYADEDPGMVKSMDLDMDDMRHVDMVDFHQSNSSMVISPQLSALNQVDSFASKYGDKVCLSTVFEEEETEEVKDKVEDEEVEKEVMEVKKMVNGHGSNPRMNIAGSFSFCPQKPEVCKPFCTNLGDDSHLVDESEAIFTALNELQNLKDSASSRQVRIQNIFTLCGNRRELSQNPKTPVATNKGFEDTASQTFPVAAVSADSSNKENLPLTPTAGLDDTSRQRFIT